MEYEEIQSNEVEALKAIYAQDFAELPSHSVWNQRPSPKFSIALRPSSEYENSPIELLLEVTMTQTYPKTLPQIGIAKTTALSGRQIETLKGCIDRTTKELKGSEMIFEVTSNIQAQLDEWARYVSEAAPNLEEDRLRRLRIKEHKQKEQQDALQREREAAAKQEEKQYDSLVLEELKKSESAEGRSRLVDDSQALIIVPESTPGVTTFENIIHLPSLFNDDNISVVFRQVMTGLKVRQPFFGTSYVSRAILPEQPRYSEQSQERERAANRADVAVLLTKVGFSSAHWHTRSGMKSLHDLNNELALIREFRHPGILPLCDFTIERFKGALVEWELTLLTPLSRLTSLAEILQSANSVNLRTAQRWSYQVLESLESLHKAGLRHKCICAENLMINVDPATGETSILLRHPQYLYTLYQLNESHPLDGGPLDPYLAKLIERNSQRTPPEGRQSKAVTPSSKWDIWQFGAMLTTMIAGNREMENMKGDIDNYVRSRRGTWPSELVDMLLQVLHPDPSKRPGALELLTDQFFRSSFDSYADNSIGGDADMSRQPPSLKSRALPTPSAEVSYSPKTGAGGATAATVYGGITTPSNRGGAAVAHEANAAGSYGRRRLSSNEENMNSRYKQDFDEGIVLGRGGFGQVVKARNKLDGRVYAVKKIRATPSTLSHILQEVVLLSRLNHQYVVRYYTVWLEDEIDDTGDGQPNDFVTSPSYDAMGAVRHDSISRAASALASRQVSNSSLLDSLPSSSLSHFTAHHSLSELDLPSVSQDFMSDSGFIEFGYSDSDEDGLVALQEQSDGESTEKSPPVSNGGQKTDTTNSLLKQGDTTRDTLSRPNQLHDSLLTRISKVVRKTLYIQMEYCENHTLGDLIRQNLYKDPDEYWRLLRQILEALAYIHGEGVIHRDLKPKNIFIDQAHNIKIGDFGLARSMVQPLQSRSNAIELGSSAGSAGAENSNSNLDEDFTTDVGTSLYAAVEITSSDYRKRGYNEKVDIFSLGIIFFEMIWKMDTEMERIQDIKRARTPQIELPAALVARKDARTQVELIRSMLSHDPAKRPSAMGLLKSGSIPVEEQNMTVQEALRNIRDPQIVQQLANALFSRPLITAQQVLYDRVNTSSAVGRRHQLSPRAESKGCLTVSYVLETLSSIFRSHGAVDNTEFRSRLFPRSALYKGPTVVELLDSQGTVLQLPHDLTLPHARRLAETAPEYAKVCAIDTVYRNRLQSPSIHPATHTEVDFDAISIDDSEEALIFDEAETIAVMYDAANTALNGPDNESGAIGNLGTDGSGAPSSHVDGGTRDESHDDFIVVISHHDILSATLSHCGLSPPQYFAALSLLAAGPLDRRGTALMRSNISTASLDMLGQFGFRELLSRSEARMSRLMPLSERVRRGLAHIKAVATTFQQLCATKNQPQIYFSPLIHSATSDFYINGIMFQLIEMTSTSKPPRQFNSGSILAAGGRYDSLIKSFRNSVLDSRTPLAKAVGFGMSADKLSVMVAKRQLQLQQSQTQTKNLVPSRCQVLVSSLSETSLRTYGVDALKLLWRYGISADIVRNIVATDDLIAQAVNENVNLVVIVKQMHALSSTNKTFKPFRVKRLGVNGAQSQPDVDLALSDLIPFLQAELGLNGGLADMESSTYIPSQSDRAYSPDFEISSDRVIIINESGKLKGGRKNKWQLEERSSEARLQFLSELGNAPIVSLDLRDDVIEAITTVSPHATEEWKRRVVGLSPNQKAYILTVQSKLCTEASKSPRMLLFSSKTENVFVYNY